MDMANTDVMKWFVRQFLGGNYRFERTSAAPAPAS